MITQIYAAQSSKEASQLVEVGVDLVGVVAGYAEFPGVFSPRRAQEILLGTGNKAKKVVLPFTEKISETISIIEQTMPDIVHIAVEPHMFNPRDTEEIRKRFPLIQIMRTIPVVDETCIELAKSYDNIADYLLLDSRNKESNQLGVTGEVHDWNLSRRIVDSVSIPVILAGGIGPDNVAAAIAYVRPYGVDSKTKTDIPGTDNKDINKVRDFVRFAKQTQ